MTEYIIFPLNPDFMTKIEAKACTEDFCFICRRPTDHGGEHTDAELLAYANR